ncbi:MAG: hypothetical protein ACPHCN_06540 [Mycobacterium sp.]
MGTAVVNGEVRSHATTELTVEDEIFDEIDAVTYNFEVSRELVYGKGPIPIGWTRGQLEVTGSITFSTDEAARRFVKKLGDGFYDIAFGIAVTYQVPNADADVDRLTTCKINSSEWGSEAGSKLSREIPFACLTGTISGLKPFADR